MNKKDLRLVLGILVAAAIAAGIFFVCMGRGQAAGTGVAEQDGEEILRFSLEEDGTIRIPSPDGTGCNVLEISGGRVRIREADCPEQICVARGWISRPGEQIVCLPHRLVIRLLAVRGGALDGIASAGTGPCGAPGPAGCWTGSCLLALGPAGCRMPRD